MQVTTKNTKKEDRLWIKTLAPESLRAKGVFQIQPRISGINFSIDIYHPK